MVRLKWLPLLPLLLLQGWWVRKKTARLPDAGGPVEGTARPGVCARERQSFDLVVLGESTVAGIGAPTHEEALTGQIAKALAVRTGRNVCWLAAGLSGATAQIAGEQLVPRLKGRRADTVVIALGVNDSIDNALKPRATDRWMDDLRRLVESVRREIGHTRIVISGAPPLSRFPAFPQPLRSFLGEQSTLLDEASRRLAGTLADVVFAPMVGGLGDSHFCEDRFHPSVEGYAAWGAHLIAECGSWIGEEKAQAKSS